MTTKTPAISVVVPMYNESGNVGPLASEVAAALDFRLPYELIFVDDCSTDATLAEIEAARAANPRISVQRHDRNRGQSAAVRTGVAAARAGTVAVLDGDGQNDPRDIPKLYEQLETVPGLALVIGERQKRNDSRLRLLSSRIANGVRAWLLGDGIRDTGCGIKVFHRDAFLVLPAFDHMHRFLPALFQRDGYGVSSVPVSHRPRLHGESKYGINNRLWVGITDLFGVIWLKRRGI